MIVWLIGLLIITAGLVLILPRLITSLYGLPRTYSIVDAPPAPVAIVFGAGLWRDGSPTPVLRDRVATAAELYFSGQVEKLLMSGDNSEISYNEPGAMRDYALSLGIPDDDIVLDYAGRRTYDTCFRAREIFGIDEAILVTQRFHLPRALYVCNQLGITASGVPADQRRYNNRSLVWWNLRETPATLVALWEVHFSRPQPILGNKEPIFPLEAQ
jgi:SanA protein